MAVDCVKLNAMKAVRPAPGAYLLGVCVMATVSGAVVEIPILPASVVRKLAKN